MGPQRGGNKKAASSAGGFRDASEGSFRVSAILPPPAASENRSTKSKSGCGLRSWAALISRVSGRANRFIGNCEGGGQKKTPPRGGVFDTAYGARAAART
ncbi:hypothetical protein BV378_01740 [Nostoc sp. RF31YmG]|nr:hypothetical protein BV378_01740 [Nostoc sp. RF31YmG]